MIEIINNMKRLNFIIILIVVMVLVFLIYYNEAIAPHETGNNSTPTPTQTVSQRESNIVVFSPKANEIVYNPIVVSGKARVFESTFSYALKDTNSNTLYENHAIASASDTGLFGNFEVQIPVPVNAPKNLIVEVFDYSAKDGSVENLVSIPVTFYYPMRKIP